ncbi:hypothetical protein [Levilactobacillus fujinensis]|uniref:Uncharacterized protein n=1 Tax=Levilactobacillus fujinensis TaxID=2486024 RepID=A0ABW1TH85_9LACO|nr:hypothetical protein [Levilactobacillus fujinensis]
MVRLIGEGLILTYLSVMGVVTLVNWQSYRQSNVLVQATGMANVLSMLVAWVVVLFLRPAFVWVGTGLILVIVVAAMLHGKALKSFHWSHHISRLVLATILVIVMWI